MSKNPNNYNKCKGIINSQDDIGNKFINWCKDNSTNANCNDLFTSKDWESLRDRYNDNILKTVCNTSDNIIKDERCKKLLDSNDLNIKNKADDVLSKYCNTDNKIFNTNPLDDPSCYRIANNKCLTASSDADKNVCNQYYINIIKKLEKNSDVNTNVLYIYYDDVNFQRLPVFYQFKKTISLSDIDNPKNFNYINQSILNNNWSAKVFAFIQPDTNANYTFLIGADDGIRFFINNINLLNNYPQYTNSKESNSIILNKDQIYFFYFEFYENDGAAKLSIQYKKDNQTEFKSIPDSWYKPFKLYSEINKFYEDTLLKYMIDYPQYFLSDSKYRIRLKNDNNDVKYEDDEDIKDDIEDINTNMDNFDDMQEGEGQKLIEADADTGDAYYYYSRNEYGMMKIEYIINILKSKSRPKNTRTLIYFQFINLSIQPLLEVLKAEQINFVAITGSDSATEKEDKVKKYNNFQVDLLIFSYAIKEGISFKETEEFYFCNLYFNYPIMEQILARAIRLTSHKKGKDAILKIFILLGVDNDEYNKHKKELDYIESAFNKGIKTILEVPKELMEEENIDGILTQRKHDFGNSGDLKMLSFVFFKQIQINNMNYKLVKYSKPFEKANDIFSSEFNEAYTKAIITKQEELQRELTIKEKIQIISPSCTI